MELKNENILTREIVDFLNNADERSIRLLHSAVLGLKDAIRKQENSK